MLRDLIKITGLLSKHKHLRHIGYYGCDGMFFLLLITEYLIQSSITNPNETHEINLKFIYAEHSMSCPQQVGDLIIPQPVGHLAT